MIKKLKEYQMIILICCLVIEVVDAVKWKVKERHKITNEDILAFVFFGIVAIAILLGIIGGIVQGNYDSIFLQLNGKLILNNPGKTFKF